MIIRTDNPQHALKTKPPVRAKDVPSRDGVPQWVDSLVPGVPVARNTAASLAAGIATGVGVGYLANQMPLGGALGAAVGLVGAIGLNVYQSSQRERRKEEVVVQHDQQRARLQERLAVPKQAGASYERASVYFTDKNMLVEFPATGTFLSVTNTGPKDPVLWVREAEAYGPGGDAVGKANGEIPETTMELSFPLRQPQKLLGGADIKRHDPLGEKEQQVELLEGGKLRFAHSGFPEGGAVYDLNSGNLDSPFLTMRDGMVEKLEMPRAESSYPPKSPFGYSYDGEVFLRVGHNDSFMRPTLPPQLLGSPVRFPQVEGANEVRTNTMLSVQNEGVFRSLELKETVLGNYLPQGAQWSPDLRDQRQGEDLNVTFQGGATLSQTRQWDESGALKSAKLLLNGAAVGGLSASASGDTVVIHKPRDPGSMYDKGYSQAITKDGTIVWTTRSTYDWSEYTFQSDGTVSGRTASTLGLEPEEPGEIEAEKLPKLLPNGTVDFGDRQQRLFVSPQQVGA